MTDAVGQIATVHDVGGSGFTVSSNTETAEEMTSNLAESTEANKDAGPIDPEQEAEEKVSKAASELGKKGGEAAAKARAKAAKEAKPEEKPEGEAKAAKPKEGDPRHDPKARMLEATRESAEVKRELAREREERARERAEFERRLAAIESRREAPPEQRPQARPANEDAEPDARNYEDYAAYVKDLGAWAARQEHAKIRERTTHEQRAHAYATAVAQAVNKFEQSVKSELPDVLERVNPVLLDLKPSWRLGPGENQGPGNVIADEIISSPHAAGIMLHLTEHPEDLQRIASLQTPRAISREMAKIEARLEVATAGTNPKGAVSQAKPPVRPVTGSPNAADPYEVDDDTPFEDHMRRMNALDQKRRREAHGR